jgi:hypothetical protein
VYCTTVFNRHVGNPEGTNVTNRNDVGTKLESGLEITYFNLVYASMLPQAIDPRTLFLYPAGYIHLQDTLLGFLRHASA